MLLLHAGQCRVVRGLYRGGLGSVCLWYIGNGKGESGVGERDVGLPCVCACEQYEYVRVSSTSMCEEQSSCVGTRGGVYVSAKYT